MRLTRRSSLATVAAAVARALEEHSVSAVLTGGACASLQSDGAYYSTDLDFVLVAATTQRRLDDAMASVGFRRDGQQYRHARARFFVEFPRGPLAIGSDVSIKPASRTTAAGRVRLLSATDSCRDRLAAFYHWSDRQSMRAAIKVAVHRRVDLPAIREWSRREGMRERFEEFEQELRRVRRARRARG